MTSVPSKRLLTVAFVSALASGLMGCENLDKDDGGFQAGFTQTEAAQRHPILVSQSPAHLSLRVARTSQGLSPQQRAQLNEFISKYSSAGSSNSRIVISVPSGAPNEVAAMRAVGDIRNMFAGSGFAESAVTVEPYYNDAEPQPPIKVSYTRFVAEGPQCGKWPTNLAVDFRNIPYENFGCAQQNNLAAMIANPADLVSARASTSASAEARAIMIDKYKKGEQTSTGRSAETAK